MERAQTFFLSICAVSILIACSNAITEHTKFGKVMSFSGGLLLLLVVLSPIVSLDQHELKRIVSSTIFEVPNIEEDFVSETQSQIDEIIMAECREYILDKAGMLGMSVDAVVRMDHVNGVSIPIKVRISGSYSPDQKEALSRILENDFDIPFSDQEWIAE